MRLDGGTKTRCMPKMLIGEKAGIAGTCDNIASQKGLDNADSCVFLFFIKARVSSKVCRDARDAKYIKCSTRPPFYRFLTSVAHPSIPSPRLPTSSPSIFMPFIPGVSSNQM